jgi:g-D-glutamyl-meso-diaminopimelate peptidase
MLPVRDYDYSELERDLEGLKSSARVGVIGQTVEDRAIYCIDLGDATAKRRLHINAGCHGVEWGTSWAIMSWIYDFLALEESSRLLSNTRIQIVPMLNPDGIARAIAGEAWSANGRGVDINHNFPANWYDVKRREIEMGITMPGPTRFGGNAPMSEPETRAICQALRAFRPHRAISLHSQGRVIYWDFDGKIIDGAYEWANRLCEISGYTLDTPEPIAQGGGFKDWFIDAFRRPAVTIEMGEGKNPLTGDELIAAYSEIAPAITYSLI